MKHLLKLENLPRPNFENLLRDTADFKRERGHHRQQPLAGQTRALMFSKQFTRTACRSRSASANSAGCRCF